MSDVWVAGMLNTGKILETFSTKKDGDQWKRVRMQGKRGGIVGGLRVNVIIIREKDFERVRKQHLHAMAIFEIDNEGD